VQSVTLSDDSLKDTEVLHVSLLFVFVVDATCEFIRLGLLCRHYSSHFTEQYGMSFSKKLGFYITCICI